MEKLGAEVANQVDWSTPRLLCIAGDFSRYDQHAVKQIARNIELIRYRRFDSSLLMLKLVHVPKQARTSPIAATSDQKSGAAPVAGEGDSDPYMSQRIDYRISQADPSLRDLFEAVRQFLIGLGDDVQVKELKYYIAFRRIKNFVCLELYPQTKVVTAYLKIDPKTVDVEEGFSRDVTNVGHFGTGILALSLRNMDDFARAQPLFRKSYENS